MAAKTATKPKPSTGQRQSREVTVTERDDDGVMISKDAPDAALAAKYGSGRGLSKSQSDNMIPLIYVMQAQSPQVLKKNPSYIQGAEAGDIWLRNAADPIIKGDEGMLFQPCAFYKEWVEWVPRDDGGGFVGRFPCKTVEDENRPPVDDAKETADEENPNAVRWVRKNGNELVFTRYHIGYVLRGNLPLPFVIPLTSTGHTFSKQWMFLMNSQQLPNGRIPDSYFSAYRLKVVPKSNKKGDWFAYDVQWEGWLNKAQIERGEVLAKAFEQGDKQIEVPEAPRSAGSGAGADDDM